MNKLFIIFLSVCLVSVHAFVKRDATKQPTELDKIQDQLNEIRNVVESKVKEALDPEELKKGVNEFLENFQKAINDLKPKEDAPK